MWHRSGCGGSQTTSESHFGGHRDPRNKGMPSHWAGREGWGCSWKHQTDEPKSWPRQFFEPTIRQPLLIVCQSCSRLQVPAVNPIFRQHRDEAESFGRGCSILARPATASAAGADRPALAVHPAAHFAWRWSNKRGRHCDAHGDCHSHWPIGSRPSEPSVCRFMCVMQTMQGRPQHHASSSAGGARELRNINSSLSLIEVEDQKRGVSRRPWGH